MVQQVVAAVQLLYDFDNQKPYNVYMCINMGVKNMNIVLENLNQWYDTMVDGGGVDLSGNLTIGHWEQNVYYQGTLMWTVPLIFRNGLWDHAYDSDFSEPYGAYTVSGNSINIQIYTAETYYTGSFSSQTSMGGTFHQKHAESNMTWTAKWKGQ